MVIAGEASGDLHAANLVRALQQKIPQCYIFGMGGNRMRAAGVDIHVGIDKLSVVGLTEMLLRLPTIISAFCRLRASLQTIQPNLLILVDYPGFNLRFAKVARKAGCQVMYYICPQLWAWHQSRVKQLKQYVDVLAVVFPFEVDFYHRFGMTAHFVGHPLVKQIADALQTAKLNHPSVNTVCNLNSIKVALLPGSRFSEIKHILPILLETARLLKQKYTNIQFVLPLASSIKKADIAPQIDEALPVQFIEHDTYGALLQCDAAVVASGTATLETALLGIPLALIYKTSWLTFFAARLVVKVPYLGICNIIAQREMIKEFIQHRAIPHAVAHEISRLLEDHSYRQTVLNDYAWLRTQLSNINATDLIQLILDSTAHPSTC